MMTSLFLWNININVLSNFFKSLMFECVNVWIHLLKKMLLVYKCEQTILTFLYIYTHCVQARLEFIKSITLNVLYQRFDHFKDMLYTLVMVLIKK